MKGLLKFITCGSVDDGKSTLIGHILYDSKLIYADQERALELASKAGSRSGKLDYSLLLDGLMEEREQGITIDVAYRYFTTDKRSFIVADTPGHEEYTRNMAVGASFADLAVILVDASQGVLVQTRRHARICALMGIRYLVFAVNKMDLTGYSEEKFRKIEEDIAALSAELNVDNFVVIPVSATEGDNVTKRSDKMPWYEGEVLLSYLETVDIEETDEEEGFYLPIQRVCRPDHTFRGFQGQVEAGSISIGDEVEILPSTQKAHVKNILIGDKESGAAVKGQPVTVVLDREVDVSRGCVICAGCKAKVITSFEATILWMDEKKLENGKNFFVKLGTNLIPGSVNKIETVIDVNTGREHEAASLEKNEIASCSISLADRVVADTFKNHRTLGEFILIDRVNFATSACGVITAAEERAAGRADRTPGEYLRLSLKGQHPVTALFKAGEDRQELLGRLERAERILAHQGRHTYLYVPKEGEDFETVVRHLESAGLVVLLVLSGEQARSAEVQAKGWISDWKEGEDSENIAEIIKRKSSFALYDATDGGYI